MHKPIFFNSVPTRPHFPAVSDCSDTWLCTVGFFTGLDCVSLGSTSSASHGSVISETQLAKAFELSVRNYAAECSLYMLSARLIHKILLC